MAHPCKLVLDNPHGTYFAGDIVSGRVVITLDKPKKIKGLLIHIKGAAKVRWTERSGNRDVRYYSDEEYFESKHYGVGGENQGEVTLTVGTHIYAFSFPLPPNLPSSYESPVGNIRYTIEAIMERPWKWNLKTKIVFTVISHYDLNVYPNLCTSAHVNASKQFCCWCCRSGSLTATLQVPKTGFVSGERIPALIEVDNATNVYINHVKLKFQQFTTFYAKHPSPRMCHGTVVFEEMKLDPVEKRGSKSWTRMLLIPPLPPSSVQECSIIDSEYQIFIEVVASGCHINLKASIPIIVGTVPYNSLPPQYETIVSDEPGTSQIASQGSQYPEPPTLTFAENAFLNAKSIQDAEDDDHTTYANDSRNFTPVYPTFGFKYQ